MKKLLSILLSALTIAAFAGCADPDLGAPIGDLPGTNGGTSDNTPGTYTVTARYDYGMHRPGLATMLYDSSTLFFALPEGFDPPVAGDEFTVTYTGQLLIQESYPSTVVISGGEIVSVAAEPAVIRTVRYDAADKSLTLLDENGEDRVLVGGITFPDYYIVSEKWEYIQLSTLTEDIVLYGSIAYTDRMSDGGVVFSGLYAQNPRPVTDEAEIRQAADRIVKTQYGITDLSPYTVEIAHNEYRDRYIVRYDLKICGYDTHESINITLSSTLDCISDFRSNGGEYSCFLKNATDEAVSDAEERLRAKIADKGDGSGFYLQIDQEGYLCLAVEFIVSIDPSEQDEMVGCGDHDHVFYTERICGVD